VTRAAAVWLRCASPEDGGGCSDQLYDKIRSYGLVGVLKIAVDEANTTPDSGLEVKPTT